MKDVDWWRATHAVLVNLVVSISFWACWVTVFGDAHPEALAWYDVAIVAALTRWQWSWHRRLDAELDQADRMQEGR